MFDKLLHPRRVIRASQPTVFCESKPCRTKIEERSSVPCINRERRENLNTLLFLFRDYISRFFGCGEGRMRKRGREQHRVKVKRAEVATTFSLSPSLALSFSLSKKVAALFFTESCALFPGRACAPNVRPTLC